MPKSDWKPRTAIQKQVWFYAAPMFEDAVALYRGWHGKANPSGVTVEYGWWIVTEDRHPTYLGKTLLDVVALRHEYDKTQLTEWEISYVDQT